MNSSVRVRFAPSPTGHLHIGNARAAILNWLYARHAGGTFILRIEDTDAERSTTESENSIYEDLRWLGLDWDEGPETGGAFGPYRQSERLVLYQEYAVQLVAAQKAYYCFCREEDLEAEREAMKNEGGQYRYSGKCRSLTPAQQQELRDRGIAPAIRFHVPARPFSFVDLARGELQFPENAFGDFVIVRSGGLPTYNFACVIDDHLMQISHVIRGDDHVINTPKQVALYEAFGWSLPQFCHIPMILGEDRSRLSKRHGATSLDQFANKGYLPAAMINFLSLLSWSSPSGEEILAIEQLVQEFDFTRLNKSPAVFDTVKLNWMNGVYLRKLNPEQLLQASMPFLQKAGFKLPETGVLQRMLALIQESLEYLEQVAEKLEFFFVERVRITEGPAIALAQTEASEKVFWSFLRQLELQETLTADSFRKMMKVVNKETGVMGKDLWMPIRVALTGNLHGPDLATIVEILGKQEVRKRILQLVE